MVNTVQTVSVYDTGIMKMIWCSKQFKESLWKALDWCMELHLTSFASWPSWVIWEVRLPIPEGCLKEWKRHSKVNTWRLKIARNAKARIHGNRPELTTAKNAVSVFSRWTITVLGSTIAWDRRITSTFANLWFTFYFQVPIWVSSCSCHFTTFLQQKRLNLIWTDQVIP